MIFDTPLYLRAIALHIQDAFPKSKVYVCCDDSPFSPTEYAVKAYVDSYGAYITIDAFESVTERYVSEFLISMIKDEMKKRSEE